MCRRSFLISDLLRLPGPSLASRISARYFFALATDTGRKIWQNAAQASSTNRFGKSNCTDARRSDIEPVRQVSAVARNLTSIKRVAKKVTAISATTAQQLKKV
jgi:hypothetical protein